MNKVRSFRASAKSRVWNLRPQFLRRGFGVSFLDLFEFLSFLSHQQIPNLVNRRAEATCHRGGLQGDCRSAWRAHPGSATRLHSYVLRFRLVDRGRTCPCANRHEHPISKTSLTHESLHSAVSWLIPRDLAAPLKV